VKIIGICRHSRAKKIGRSKAALVSIHLVNFDMIAKLCTLLTRLQASLIDQNERGIQYLLTALLYNLQSNRTSHLTSSITCIHTCMKRNLVLINVRKQDHFSFLPPKMSRIYSYENSPLKKSTKAKQCNSDTIFQLIPTPINMQNGLDV
jgi:hypothetical protein